MSDELANSSSDEMSDAELLRAIKSAKSETREQRIELWGFVTQWEYRQDLKRRVNQIISENFPP